MFLSKKNDILMCNNNAYKVMNLFEFNNEEYLILMSMVAPLNEIIVKDAPLYIAKEIVDENSSNYYIEIIEDKNLINNILDFYHKR